MKLSALFLSISGLFIAEASARDVRADIQRANDFEYLPIMNTGHGAAETPYGKRRRAEFLVRHLIGLGD